jgi:hypothetical protein
MKRLASLETRKAALLERIEQQREEIALQARQLTPKQQLHRLGRAAGNHPLAWILGVAALFFLSRARRLSWLPWLAGGLSLAGRVGRLTRLLRLVGEIRQLRSGFR